MWVWTHLRRGTIKRSKAETGMNYWREPVRAMPLPRHVRVFVSLKKVRDPVYSLESPAMWQQSLLSANIAQN